MHGKIAQGGLIKQMLAEKKTPEEIIEKVYIRSLTRKPTPEETAQLMKVVQTAPDPDAGLQDVFWAVLNSREFIFNH